MKRLVVTLLCSMAWATSSFAQKNKEPVALPDLPVDSVTGLYTYTKVVELPGTAKNELYKRALTWANEYYKNPGDVLREKNPQAGKILIKARFGISNEPDKKGVITQAGDVMYSLTLNFKDNKYKYEISKINWQQISYYPIERWKDTEASSFKPAYLNYLVQTDEEIKKVIAEFTKSIGEPAKVKASDW